MSEGLKELDHQAPVVMVNLMRFRERSLDGDGSGWDAYLRYSALTVPMIKARGGTLLWTGDAKAVALGRQDGNQWDYLALVYYPDRRRLHRHDDVGGLRDALRPAPHQRLRRARDHRDERGVQQVQDGVDSRRITAVMLRKRGIQSPRFAQSGPGIGHPLAMTQLRPVALKTSAPGPA